ncbi:NAD kinase [Flavilitoribacter nigricans]|uniref:NAD kinase n=1 Tax=Flavilitoribacter nigricans (strain ATCC 23147 / DSM 23189 / NBRC 102662 / NCIMB 1420 / SS-2) TaxID=1122177 RepID=A0A2D0N754_FLAN2|nr:NAD kinase [Flavilitoribacter nigricans]PHN03593.1 NAD kinase [Flavilitoribacter nigricans DSM 23189 = NBRC 102662]
MQVVVFSKLAKEEDLPHIQELFDVLHDENITSYVHAPFLHQLRDNIQLRRDVGVFEGYLDLTVKKFDFFITLGGDGTILEAFTYVRNSEVPVVGINLGRLGFLASIEKKRIREAIILLKRGMYTVEERGSIYLESNFPLFDETPFALNDCTLLKRDTSSMITVHTYINGAYLNSYWADGIIVATPTGSTGYSLSCGGPVIFPDSGNFVITPVAPHNLNVRPIVISDDSIVSFEIEGRAENFLCTLDSRFEMVTAAHQLAVRKNDFKLKLVQLYDIGFLETIRNKLAWGVDTRNY